jgi:hypothetical protein
MKRWHEEALMAHHRRVVRHRLVEGVTGDCDLRYDAVGRFRKRKPLACGKVHCSLCHCDKYPVRTKTVQELRKNDSFRDQLKELN